MGSGNTMINSACKICKSYEHQTSGHSEQSNTNINAVCRVCSKTIEFPGYARVSPGQVMDHKWCDTCSQAPYRSQQTVGVLEEVFRMRQKQDAKWGRQDHPPRDPLVQRQMDAGWIDSSTVHRTLRVPSEEDAKNNCNRALSEGRGNWDEIHLEEFCEMISATTPEERRAELLDLAGTCVSEIEAIDRKLGRWPK